VKFAVVGNAIFVAKDNAASQRGWFFYRETGALKFGYTANGSTVVVVLNNAWVPGTTAWYHLAATRSGNSWRYFVDGTQLGSTATDTGTIFDGTSVTRVGGGYVAGYTMNGWIAAVRVTKGVARYTGNFTPPSLPLPTS